MPTVIDSLIVELGLDPTAFNKGQKEAAAAFLKTKETAVATGKDIEEASQKVAANINRLTRDVIALFGAIAGARSLKDLISGLTEANAELGRFSVNMAESPQTVAAWGMAAQRIGGSAKATTDTIQKMGQALYNLRYHGQALPDAFYQLQAVTGKRIATNQGPVDFLKDVGSALADLAKTDPNRAFNIAQAMGIDAGTFNLMRQQGSALGEYIDALKKSVAPSDKAIEAAQKLQTAWFELTQQAGALINKLYELAGPTLTALLDQMVAWLDANKDWLAAEIADKVQKLAEWLEKIDWNGVVDGANQFATAAGDMADAIGGVTTAVEVLFGLWLGSKFLAVLANMRLLAAAGAGSGAAAAGGGSLAAIAPYLAVLGAILSVRGDSANKNEYLDASADERVKMREESRLNATAYNRGYDKWNIGPSAHRGRRDRGDIERDRSLGAFIDGAKVDGRPVSRSNPMPVTVQGQGSGSGGVGFWSGVLDWFTGAGKANASTGGNADIDDASSTSASPVKGSAKRLMDRLVAKHGWTTAAAAISASQAWAESSFNPGASGDPQVPGGSHGLFQWNRSRLAKLKKFAAARGADWKDFDTQVDFHAAEAEEMIPGWGKTADLSDADGLGKRYEGYRGPIQKKRSRQAANYLRGYQTPEPGLAASPALGARGAAQMSAITNNTSSRSSSSTVDTRIGTVNINTAATDANGIAGELWGSLDSKIRRSSSAAAAQAGPV